MFAFCVAPTSECCNAPRACPLRASQEDPGQVVALKPVILGQENPQPLKPDGEEEVDATPWVQLAVDAEPMSAEVSRIASLPSLPGVLPRDVVPAAEGAAPDVGLRDDVDERPENAPWKTGRSSRSGATSATSRDPEREARKHQLRRFLASAGFRGVNEPRSRGGLLPFSRNLSFPLHTAVKACDAEIVELLVWAGADRSKRDAQQATALELARRLDRRGSHAAIISALEATATAIAASPTAAASP